MASPVFAFPLLRSLRGCVALLTLVTVLPGIILSGYVAFQAYDHERESAERRLLETSRALSLVVDRQLGQAEATLRTLASSPYLHRGDYAAFHQQAERVVAGTRRRIALVAADGTLLASTTLPARRGEQPLRFNAPAELHAHLRDHEVFVSNLLPDPLAEGHILLIALRLDSSPSPRRLVMALPPDSLHSILADQQIPPSWNVSIIDRASVIVARSRRPGEFVGRTATDRARAAIESATAGVFRSIALDGVESIGAFNRLRESGWTVVLSAPAAELSAAADRLLTTVAAAAFLLVAAAIAAAFFIGRLILRAMARLNQDAHAVGRGEIPAPAHHRLNDARLVSDALRDSAIRLKQGEAELIRLNETLESRVQEATERLVASGRLEAIGRLTGGIAHDFNNLLAAIRINLDLVARHFPAPKSLGFVQSARESSERGTKLVAQLLAFARQQRLAPEPVDVNAVAEFMAQMLRTSLAARIEIRLDLAADLPPALTDRTQLEMIVMNLAINARDAMGEGGLITIGTERVRVDAPLRRPEAPAPGEYVQVTVADTGSGMPPELLARVFEPFFTTKPVGRGSGLGLSQVLGIVKQLGGGLRIDSAPGAGTSVHVFLPLAGAAMQQGASPSEPPACSHFAQLAVLLVDDDPAVRQPAAVLLEDMGCRVTSAEDGAAALGLIAAGAAPELALLDYAMPGMTGLELAMQLADRPQAPVIVIMTGYAEIGQLSGKWQGPILQKPFSQEALAETIARALSAAGKGSRCA